MPAPEAARTDDYSTRIDRTRRCADASATRRSCGGHSGGDNAVEALRTVSQTDTHFMARLADPEGHACAILARAAAFNARVLVLQAVARGYLSRARVRRIRVPAPDAPGSPPLLRAHVA